ncbi:MAG: inositol monophosphatase, partial [Actinobacteria bacterium]|nr:inositol monophosphatase [Actinomycetota bacterium]
WKSYRGETTVVTDADLAADGCIRAIIQARHPAHTVLSEEFPHAEIYGDDVWVIDPLDGTDNYARGQPQFCVSVAHARGGVTDVGVVVDPIRQEVFTVTADARPALNGVGIAVSSRDDPGTAAAVWAQRGIDAADGARVRASLAAAAGLYHRARLTGTAALELAWIAAGRYDAGLFGNLNWWDQAAAALLVERAGGRVTDLRGQPMSPHVRRCVASNGALHDRTLALCAAFDLYIEPAAAAG